MLDTVEVFTVQAVISRPLQVSRELDSLFTAMTLVAAQENPHCLCRVVALTWIAPV